jgi:hypothetical protein
VNGEVASLSMAAKSPVIRRAVQFQKTERTGLMGYIVILYPGPKLQNIKLSLHIYHRSHNFLTHLKSMLLHIIVSY